MAQLPVPSLAHLAFVCPPFVGHLAPFQALGRELVARGHRATFVGIADAEPFVDGASFGYRAVGRASHPPGTLVGIKGRMAAIDGFVGLGGIIRDVTAATDMLARELPGALREIGADLLVCDGTEAAGALAAESVGIPLVTLAAALPLNREPAVPPPFTGWGYDPSPWGLERNRGGYRVSDWLMRGHGKVIAEQAERLGLKPRATLEACLSPLAQISQLVPGLDMPRAELPPHFHYCGPLRDLAPYGAATRPRVEGARRGYASLGTLQGGRLGLLRRIAKAGRRAGFDLVISHGGALGAAEAARLPGRHRVEAWVEQREVLAGADLAILNGGLNSVLDALAAGLPVVTIPIAFEQAAIGARLKRAGAGRSVGRRLLTAGRLARVVRDVFERPSFAAAAGALRSEIAAAGGVRRAAAVVERVLATGGPVTAEPSPPPADIPQPRYAA